MSGVEILTDSPLWHAGEGDQLIHLTCCIADNVPLCGVGGVSEGWTDDEPNCRRCLELDSIYALCPAGFNCADLPGDES